MRIGDIFSMNINTNTTMGLTMQLEIGDCIPKKVYKVHDFIEFVVHKKLRILHKHKDTKFLRVSLK